jgi:hypothetical protein
MGWLIWLRTVQGIRARLSELAPVVAEYERLQAAYTALEGSSADSADRLSAGAGTRDGRGASARRVRGRSASRPSRPRAPRGQNKAAVFGVITERPGVTVTEIAQVTGIAKPLIYNTTRAGVERGELERVALSGGQQGFRVPKEASASEPAAPVS